MTPQRLISQKINKQTKCIQHNVVLLIIFNKLSAIIVFFYFNYDFKRRLIIYA